MAPGSFGQFSRFPVIPSLCLVPWQRFLVSWSCLEGLLQFGAVKTQDPLSAQPERFVYPNDLKGTALSCINLLRFVGIGSEGMGRRTKIPRG